MTLPLSFNSRIAEQTHERWQPLNRKNSKWPNIDDHPGDWECQWRQDRDVLRTFRFTVGADGRIVPHAEQSAGLELDPNIFFVETEIPAKGSIFDSRVHRNSVNRGAFLGRGFKSPEGKALVRKLPNVGQPTPRSR